MAKKKQSSIEKLLTEDQLAKETNLKARFIKDARLKHGLPYFKLGRLVKIRMSDFEEWLEQRKVS